MDNTTTTPEYLFESSWEVCNKVGLVFIPSFQRKLIRYNSHLKIS